MPEIKRAGMMNLILAVLWKIIELKIKDNPMEEKNEPIIPKTKKDFLFFFL